MKLYLEQECMHILSSWWRIRDLPNQMPKYEKSQIRETSELDSLNINREGHY